VKAFLFAWILGTSLLFSAVAEIPSVLESAEEKSGSTKGTFAGIDQGDYFYFLLETTGDQQESFFILKPDETVEAFIDAPEKYLGRDVVVYWVQREMNIPQAGGVELIKEIKKVELK